MEMGLVRRGEGGEGEGSKMSLFADVVYMNP